MSDIQNIFEEIKLVKDIVPVEYQNKIVDFVKGENSFPWYTIDKIGHNEYFSDVENPYIDKKVTDHGGFYHLLYDEGEERSDDGYMFAPILQSYCKICCIDLQEIYRIRMRFTHPVPNHSSENYAAPHIDYKSKVPFTTLVYYIDDSDGDTILFSKKHDPKKEYNPIITEKLTEVYRHTPKKGEALIFSGHRYHSGNYPLNFSKRMVINFDFVEKK